MNIETWIPFMRLGKHTDSKGRPFEADDAVLNKIIEMNKGREYPLAIGHPKTDSPAYGWADTIKREGDMLYAKSKSMVAEFADWVKKGLWKTISVALNPDMTIRHIGFLGATPPAIEGLTAEFKADDTGMIIEFSKLENQNQNKEETHMKKLLALLGLTETATEDDAIAAVNGIKTSASAVFASKAVLDALELKPEATEAEVVGLIKTFSQSHAKVIDLQKDNAKLEKAIRDGEAEDVVRFARTKGKITREQEPWALEYAKNDIDGFRLYVNKAPVVLDPEFTEKGVHQFVSPGSDVDMDTVQAIASKAMEFQAAAEKNGRTVTISEAVGAVIKKKR
jgi:hypothetical protein